MGARIAMNRLRRSDQGLHKLNFTFGLSGERRVSATARLMLQGHVTVKHGFKTSRILGIWTEDGEVSERCQDMAE